MKKFKNKIDVFDTLCQELREIIIKTKNYGYWRYIYQLLILMALSEEETDLTMPDKQWYLEYFGDLTEEEAVEKETRDLLQDFEQRKKNK